MLEVRVHLSKQAFILPDKNENASEPKPWLLVETLVLAHAEWP